MLLNSADRYELTMRLQVAEHYASWASDCRALLADLPPHHPATGGILAAIAASENVLTSVCTPLEG